jgi:hypothetical protein
MNGRPTPDDEAAGKRSLCSGMLRRDQHGAFRVRRDLVRDTAEDGAGERAPSTLTARRTTGARLLLAVRMEIGPLASTSRP